MTDFQNDASKDQASKFRNPGPRGALGFRLMGVAAIAAALGIWEMREARTAQPSPVAPQEVGAGPGTPSPIASASPDADPSPSGSPTPTPTPITPDEARTMSREFDRAQRTEIKALEHRQKIEIRELKASHEARMKEWLSRERDARHAYFKVHTKGPERRAYIQDFMSRRKSLKQAMDEELTQRKRDQATRVDAVKADQATRRKEFQESIQRGERPSDRLWPGAGG